LQGGSFLPNWLNDPDYTEGSSSFTLPNDANVNESNGSGPVAKPPATPQHNRNVHGYNEIGEKNGKNIDAESTSSSNPVIGEGMATIKRNIHSKLIAETPVGKRLNFAIGCLENISLHSFNSLQKTPVEKKVNLESNSNSSLENAALESCNSSSSSLILQVPDEINLASGSFQTQLTCEGTVVDLEPSTSPLNLDDNNVPDFVRLHPTLKLALSRTHLSSGQRTIDLSGCGIESCLGLACVCPKLMECFLQDNSLRNLEGLSPRIFHLQIARNRVASSTSFNSFVHLQSLDLSGNGLSELIGLQTLVHLRTLVAENNFIRSWSSLASLPSLEILSLADNMLLEVDASKISFPNLKRLNLNQNNISSIRNLVAIPHLNYLSIASNALSDLVSVSHSQLETLDVSDNLLKSFDGTGFPNLRQLYLEGNQVSHMDLSAFDTLDTLLLNGQSQWLPEKVSSGDYRSNILQCPSADLFSQLQPVGKLSLADIRLTSLEELRHMHQLVVLDLRRCGLRKLPLKFSRSVPSLRELDVSQNCLNDISPIASCRRLRTLVLRSNDLDDFFHALEQLNCLKQLQFLDLRQNPVTALFYPTPPPGSLKPIISKNLNSCGRSLSGESTRWVQLDRAFQVCLNDLTHVRRTCYRTSLIYHLQASLKELDCIPVTSSDIELVSSRYRKMEQNLHQILSRTRATPNMGTGTNASPVNATPLDTYSSKLNPPIHEIAMGESLYGDLTSESAVLLEMQHVLGSPAAKKAIIGSEIWKSRSLASNSSPASSTGTVLRFNPPKSRKILEQWKSEPIAPSDELGESRDISHVVIEEELKICNNPIPMSAPSDDVV
jgi:Leucine-rich repeat (LRR) protein